MKDNKYRERHRKVGKELQLLGKSEIRGNRGNVSEREKQPPTPPYQTPVPLLHRCCRLIAVDQSLLFETTHDVDPLWMVWMVIQEVKATEDS